jgi:hypothetical protein
MPRLARKKPRQRRKKKPGDVERIEAAEEQAKKSKKRCKVKIRASLHPRAGVAESDLKSNSRKPKM